MENEENLTEYIKNEIKKHGPVTFARFMEIALYHPGLGYYTSPGEKIGAAGDYYTSSDVHPVFGTMLARQLAEMWVLLKKPTYWPLMEFGAGKGLLARDLLHALQKNHPDAWQAVTYFIIERSPCLAARQRQILAGIPDGKVRWLQSLVQVKEQLTGCLFGNEVVDAFPVHRIRQTANGPKEIFVTCRNGEFTEILQEPSTPLLRASLQELGISLEEEQTVEINLAARNWLQEIASHLAAGFLMTIDYGGEAEEMCHPRRFNGTLRCFSQHRLNTNPYQHIGTQDITASVNFTLLKKWGEEAGLKTAGYTTQMNFLLNLGILETVKPAVDYVFNWENTRSTLAIKKLVMPEGMGRDFKVLCQYKGLNELPVLTGYNGQFRGALC